MEVLPAWATVDAVRPWELLMVHLAFSGQGLQVEAFARYFVPLPLRPTLWRTSPAGQT